MWGFVGGLWLSSPKTLKPSIRPSKPENEENPTHEVRVSFMVVHIGALPTSGHYRTMIAQ